MEEKRLKEIYRDRLTFAGRVISIFNHELKNHLAVVRESAGLIRDSIEFRKHPEKNDPKEYLKTVSIIEEQILRTVDLMTGFGRFAAGLESGTTSFDLCEALNQLISLMNRHLRQKEMVIERDFKQGLPNLTGDVADIQYVAWLIIMEAMELVLRRGRVAIAVSARDKTLEVSFKAYQGNSEVRFDKEGPGFLEAAAAASTTGVGICEREGAIILSIPLTIQ